MLSMLLATGVLTGGVETTAPVSVIPDVSFASTVDLSEFEETEQPPVDDTLTDAERRRRLEESRRAERGPMAGQWEFTLSGGGISDHNFRNNNYQFNASIGHFLTDELEIAFRQAVNFSELGGDSVVRASSRGAIDFHFDFDQFQPFIGANIGYVYGDGGDTWVAGPEAGLKLFVTEETFVFGMVEYLIFFRNLSDVDDRARRGEFVFTLGIGFLW